MGYTQFNWLKLSKLVLSGAMLAAVAVLAVPALSGANGVVKGHKDVCNRGAAVHCQAKVVTDSKTGKPLATVSYAGGYAPASLQSAYNLPGLPAPGSAFAWNGQTVAIVDAYDNPNAAHDLVAYRRQFGLPLCPTSNPSPTITDLSSCMFTKVNENGQTSPLPSGDTGWGAEIDLDIDMVSATCPSCKILLLEASAPTFSDLGTAVDQAAIMGANSISNSYGGSEFSFEQFSFYQGHYNHPGIAVTVSSGDSGYGVEFPAASQYVTAVGGTSLTHVASSNMRAWTETAWSGAGSGCSAYIGKLLWQPTIGTCNHRVVADVSAVADPNTGVAVYDSYGSSGGANWYVYGGTSVGSPLIASVYALAGNAGGLAPGIIYGEHPYAHTAGLYDVTSGSNGSCTSRRSDANYALCHAVAGFDGPTGPGTPNGLSAF